MKTGFSRYEIYEDTVLAGPAKRNSFSPMSFVLISDHSWRW